MNKAYDTIKRKSDDELKEQLVRLHRERFNLRFRQANGQLQATHPIAKARRDIARIKTLQSQRRTAIPRRTAVPQQIETKD